MVRHVWAWLHMVALVCVVLRDFVWFRVVSPGLAWFRIVSHGFPWFCVVLHVVLNDLCDSHDVCFLQSCVVL